MTAAESLSPSRHFSRSRTYVYFRMTNETSKHWCRSHRVLRCDPVGIIRFMCIFSRDNTKRTNERSTNMHGNLYDFSLLVIKKKKTQNFANNRAQSFAVANFFSEWINEYWKSTYKLLYVNHPFNFHNFSSLLQVSFILHMIKITKCPRSNLIGKI